MSKILRAHDLPPREVRRVDLRERPMVPPPARRPEGGFAGFRPGAPQPAPLSDIERREREAAALVEAARRQAEAIQRDAYRQGFEQGERAGEKLAAQKLDSTLQVLHTLLDAIAADRARLIEDHRRELITVAMAVAARVLRRAVELHPEAVADVVEAALEKAGRCERVTLRLSPHDRVLVEQLMRRRYGAWPPPTIAIVEDESVGRGGCRVNTEIGDIDATIEAQWRALRDAACGDA